jgi:competence ComEA-like helix-hairpin-helix protein
MASQKRQKKIDLNQADPEQLEQLEGIDSERARLIAEHREEIGIFQSWEDVATLPGIGRKLVEKLQAQAILGEGGGGRQRRGARAAGQGQRRRGQPAPTRQAQPAQQSAEESSAEEQSDEDEAEEAEGQQAEGEVEPESQLLALVALAEMDLGAAAAYEIASRCFEDEDEQVSKQLLAFRGDHLRHVESLERLAQAMGAEEIDREGAEQSVLARLAEAAEALGPRAALLAMISNEQLTNSAYESILQLQWEDEVQSVLERNLQDEQRHLRWLQQHRDRFAEQEQPGAHT